MHQKVTSNKSQNSRNLSSVNTAQKLLEAKLLIANTSFLSSSRSGAQTNKLKCQSNETGKQNEKFSSIAFELRR